MAHNGAEALAILGPLSVPAVLVVAIRLPDSDGRDVCLALRSMGQDAPVLFLTTLDARADRLAAFGVGGDDYVHKPFEILELIARLEALERRVRPSSAPSTELGLELDPVRHAVRTRRGEALLTPTEFRMLGAITSRADEVVRRHVVVAAAWPDGRPVADNTVDSFMRRIRGKLREIESPVEIHSVRGVGFRLR